MVRIISSLVVIVGCVVLGVGCGPERPEALTPIKVGTIGSTSGSLATFGEALQDAIGLAAENVNAAGGLFDGRPIEVIARDSTSDPATAAVMAQQLLDEGVVAIVGPETSGQSLQVLEVAKEASVPMVSCCATSAELSSQNAVNGGFFFRTAPSDALQGKALAYIAKNGATVGASTFAACPQAAFFSRGDSYGDGFKTIFVNNYQGQSVGGVTTTIVAEGSFPSDDPNVGEIDTAANAFATAIIAGADPTRHLCVAFITFGGEGGRLLRRVDERLSATALSYHYLTGDGAQESAFLDEMNNAGAATRARVLGTVPFHAENAAYDEFTVSFTARHGYTPPAYSSQAFDAMFITALAITKARSENPVEIRNAMFDVSGRGGGRRFDDGNFFGEIAATILAGESVDYIGPSGELTFDSFGDVQGDYVLWQVAEVDGALNFVDRAPLPVALFDPR